MINTVLQAIERYESSGAFSETQIPTAVLDSGGENEAVTLVDSEEDTSDDSEEYKDIQEQVNPVCTKQTTDRALIKQTLKDKIRFRRESEGADEIMTLFEPPKQYQLTPEEEVKNEIRKQRNRRSATKSRLKRIAREKQLEEDADSLEKEHTEKLKEVKALKKIKVLLAAVLKGHLVKCPRLQAASKASFHCNTEAVAPTGLQTSQSTRNVSTLQLLTPTTSDCLQTNFGHQPGILQLPLKRKAEDEFHEQQPFKVPKVWNSRGVVQATSAHNDTAVRTCINNSLGQVHARSTEVATSQMDMNGLFQSVSMAPSVSLQSRTNENVLCEIPSTPNQPFLPLSSAGRNSSLGRQTDSVFGGIDVNYKSQSADVTEQQKINLIKQHLLDGFPLATSR